MSDMQGIKQHFEEEAAEFDNIIKKLIPYYPQMVAAIVNTLPFNNYEHMEVIDLGCGTATVARAIKDKFPKVRLTCLDMANKMLQMAQLKLADDQDTLYINCDFYNFNFEGQYDAVVSSLALHHLITKDDKLDFYRKIYAGLKKQGVFVNADVVLASTDVLQNQYMEQWKSFLCNNVSQEDIENKWIPKYHEEDRPISIMEHLEMLKQAGFGTIDVVWKYYNFAVYMAVK